jgi:hypothetical protein
MLHPLFPVRRFVRDFFAANGLDGASSMAGYDLLRSRLDGRCAIVVSHDRSVVRQEEGDRIVEL